MSFTTFQAGSSLDSGAEAYRSNIARPDGWASFFHLSLRRSST